MRWSSDLFDLCWLNHKKMPIICLVNKKCASTGKYSRIDIFFVAFALFFYQMVIYDLFSQSKWSMRCFDYRIFIILCNACWENKNVITIISLFDEINFNLTKQVTNHRIQQQDRAITHSYKAKQLMREEKKNQQIIVWYN